MNDWSLQMFEQNNDTNVFEELTKSHSELSDNHFGETLLNVSLDLILPFSLGNTRSNRDPVKFKELKDSVRRKGVFQPVVLRPHHTKDGFYEIIAGNGRFEASVEVGKETIPAVIKSLSDVEAIEIQLIENSNREDLSLVDEAKSAQRWIAFYDGDRESAAERLSWPIKKLNERLELLRCNDAILDALEAGKIKPAHAMILAPFSLTRQTATLETIINEKWSVKTLQERAGKAQVYLAKAKFDIAECSGCEFNTEMQAGLFDTDAKAKCSNIECFKTKTKGFVKEARVRAEETYGKVLLWMDINSRDRNTVNEDTVGNKQYTQGCVGCESKVSLMDDRDGQEGNLIKNQCIDKVCYKKVTSSEQASPVAAQVSNQITSQDGIARTPIEKTKKPKLAQKSSKQVIEQSRNELRALSSKHVLPLDNFQLAVTLSAISKQCNYKADIDNWAVSCNDSFNKNVILGIKETVSKLNEEIKKATAFLAIEAKNNSYGDSEQFTNLMIGCFTKNPEHKSIAITNWKPTKDNLSVHTIEQLVQLCTNSGFKSDYEKSEPEAAFSKLASKNKSLFIDAILNFEFDWAAFAPDKGYLDQVK